MNSAAALYLLAGVCVFAALNHLLAALRPGFKAPNAWFAALSATAASFILTLALSYQASTVPQYVHALKWNIAFVAALYMIFPWYIARLTGLGSFPWLITCTISLAIVQVLNAVQPYGLTYSEITQLAAVRLPWGETMPRPEGRIAPTFWFGCTVIIASLAVALVWLVRAWRRSRERTLLFMLLAVAVQLLSGLEGIMVRAGLIDFVHAGPFGYVVMIVAMSLALSHLTQKVLRESERRFRSLVEQSPFSIQVLSADGRSLQVNEAWRRLWHRDAGEPGSDNDAIKPYLDHASRGTAVEIPPRQHQQQWIRTFIYPIKDTSGIVLNLILMHEDVSEQHRADEAMRAVTEELRQTQRAVLQQERLRALGQMASGVAHDINNAISPASVYVEALLTHEHTLSKRAREYLAITRQAIDAVAQSVMRLREFYRPREPHASLQRLDVNEMIGQVIDLTRARWRDIPQQRGIVIQLRPELTAGLQAIMGSEAELRDSMTNLVFNAVDAMPNGGTLLIRSRLRNGSVCVEFVDTGLGMSEETRRRCMEPFFTTKGERGTGLGLATVYGMAQRHGGDVEIESEPGKGTLVRLVFPVGAAESSHSPKSETILQLDCGVKILLIDDDAVQLESLRESLEMSGCRVTCASGGQAGIDAFLAAAESAEPYAVVITDLGMPHVDGRGVASTVARASPATPVILLTGWGQSLQEQNDIPAGVTRVMTKPPNVGRLRAAVAEVLEQRRPAPAR
jgi:signal transduction histidine kinase/ActR/RegA family two-component response regulator